MILRLFFTDFRRSLAICISAVILSFILGFVTITSIDLSSYLADLFRPLKWGADILILPKGETPELAWKDILNGKPQALIPETLLETLKNQIAGEQVKFNLTSPSLQVFGFVPYLNDSGQASLATIGEAKQFFSATNDKSVLDSYEKNDWNSVYDKFANLESYQTAEWGSKVILGILVKGSDAALKSLKTLIDRRTVAQAYYVNFENDANQDSKFLKLKSILNKLTFFILALVAIGLFLSLQTLKNNRKNIFQNFDELRFPKLMKYQFYLTQIMFLILIPALFGFLLATNMLSIIKTSL